MRAVLVEDAAKSVARAPRMSDDRVRAEVRGTAADGSTRAGRALVDSGHEAGSKILVWMDSEGELTTEPPTATRAAAQAGLLGTVAALAFGGTAFAAGRVAPWRLDRRRYEELGRGRAWDRVGPQWGTHVRVIWSRLTGAGPPLWLRSALVEASPYCRTYWAG